MANWNNTVNIADLIQDEHIEAADAARQTRERLVDMQPHLKFSALTSPSVAEEIRDGFQDVIDHLEGIADVEDYDTVLEELYDLGDQALDDHPLGRKFLWIETNDVAGASRTDG